MSRTASGEKNSDDLKDEITTDSVLTTDGQWMGDPLRSHEESMKTAQRGLKEGSKRAQRGLSIDSDISHFVVKRLSR